MFSRPRKLIRRYSGGQDYTSQHALLGGSSTYTLDHGRFDFWSLSGRQDNLRTLKFIRSCPDFSASSISDDNDRALSFPRLAEISGDFEHIVAIVPYHPITSVTVRLFTPITVSVRDFARALGLSAGPLKQLELIAAGENGIPWDTIRIIGETGVGATLRTLTIRMAYDWEPGKAPIPKKEIERFAAFQLLERFELCAPIYLSTGPSETEQSLDDWKHYCPKLRSVKLLGAALN
ncbi:hypothetical protein RhiLY_06730 [Ceratobasidium sp. AG-Ba]|nr:hypothetical protein RhiLY_06730 [Ceratobasidium sp. AG-Ba]